jgi:hypothetical protein
VSLIALTSLLQELPAERPAWVRRSCVLPLHTVSAHYLQRYGERFSGDQEKRTLPFISKMMASAQERQITSFKVTFIFIIPFFQPLSSDILFLLNVLQIHFKKKEKKMKGKRPQYFTSSWKKAMAEMGKMILGRISDEDVLISDYSEEEEEEEEEGEGEEEEEEEEEEKEEVG